MRLQSDKKPEPFGVRRICEVCGKKFTPAMYHIFVDYKYNRQGKLQKKLYYCVWTCYNRRKETKQYLTTRKVVQQYSLDGELIAEYKKAQDAALALVDKGINASIRTIQAACRGEYGAYHGYIWKYKGGENEK